MFAGRVSGETALYLGDPGAPFAGGVWLSHISIFGPGIAR